MSKASALSRRQALQLAAAGVVGTSSSGWFGALADETARNPQRRRSCILLWMNGGPTQTDTFDLKTGHPTNGGPFRGIQTSAPGVRISEHLPRLADQMEHAAIIRAMSSREGDHGRGTFLMHTGYLPQGPIQYPTMGSLIAKQLGAEDAPLPNFVSIAPFRQFSAAAHGSGFLGPQYAPLIVGESANPFNPQPNQGDAYAQALRVQDMQNSGTTTQQFDARVNLLQDMERDFVSSHPTVAARSHQTAYDRAVRLMRTSARTAFTLDDEPARLRDSYGRNLFGQGCLLARRLVERGVPFVEVSLSGIPNAPIGWDTHGQNFNTVQRLCEILDPAWATLIKDLKQRGMLDSTLIVWMGEFGRTPRINGQQGRDHYPNAWSTVLCGGGIKGGSVFGDTGADGTAVVGPRPVSVPDFFATICQALGIDPTTQNMSNVGRPIRVADHNAQPVTEILA